MITQENKPPHWGFFYGRHFAILSFHLVLLQSIGAHAANMGIFLFAYSCVWPFWTPGLRERVLSKQYRFSFLRLCFFIHGLANALLQTDGHPVREMLARMLTPLFLAAPLLFLTGLPGGWVYLLWGPLACESSASLWHILHSTLKSGKH